MAKKPVKEASTALVVSLVFFVLTTIAFGVMWYMQYSDQAANEAKMKENDKKVAAASAVQKDAENLVKLYRGYLGINTGEEMTSLLADHKAGDKLSTELKRINDEMAKKGGYEDASKLPASLMVWNVDASGKIGDRATKSLIEVVNQAESDRDASAKAEKKSNADWAAAVADARKAIDAYNASKKDLEDSVVALTTKSAADLKKAVAKYDENTKNYIDAEAKARTAIDELNELIAKKDREKEKLNQDIVTLRELVSNQKLKLTQNKDTFANDEAQGKVLRTNIADRTVEIDLGLSDLVRQGLTFSVLPYDFPIKGRQSRMREFRVRDSKGEYKSELRFVPKGTLEVIEVLGPHLSRCRITDEANSIKDSISLGDLLYNSVWRKGTTDHIALIGVFDMNGDGIDDIESVIRDLRKMGIPIDAYFDMKTRKWVGEITNQTRYVIEGQFPIIIGADPLLEEKGKLRHALLTAEDNPKEKGVSIINYKDFFPRMGYRVKIDVPDDKINQAMAQYLNRVAAVDNAPPQP